MSKPSGSVTVVANWNSGGQAHTNVATFSPQNAADAKGHAHFYRTNYGAQVSFSHGGDTGKVGSAAEIDEHA